MKNKATKELRKFNKLMEGLVSELKEKVSGMDESAVKRRAEVSEQLYVDLKQLLAACREEGCGPDETGKRVVQMFRDAGNRIRRGDRGDQEVIQ